MEDTIHVGTEARWARHTIETALRRMALLLATSELAMAVLGLVTSGVGESVHTRLATWISLLIALGLWCWYLVQPQRTSAYLVFGLAQFAAVAAAGTTATELHNGGSPIDWAPNIVALVAGLLLPVRATFAMTIATAGGTATIITLTMMQAGASFSACVVPALTRAIYILCDGWAAGGVSEALRSVANRADTAAAESEQEQVTAARLRSTEAATAELARVLHDSAVNTFAAIASGRLASAPGTVKARCSQDVKTLTDLLGRDAGSSIIGGPMSWQTLTNEGVSLTFVGATEDTVTEMLATLPATVSRAFIASMAEAVRNVAKHSEVTEATIAVHRADAVEFGVIDTGRGFDGTVPAGRGLQRSIVDRCASAGIDVKISSEPGHGTEVRLSYTPPSHSSLDEQNERENREFLTEVVWIALRRLTACLLVLCSSMTLLYSSDGLERSSAVALVVMALSSWLVFSQCKGTLQMPSWLIAALLASIPVIMLAPGWDQVGCARVGYEAWGPDGNILAMMMLVMLARRGWVLPTILTVFIASAILWSTEIASKVPASCPSTATTSAVFNVVIIIGFWLFRQKLWALTAEASAASKAATAARLQTEATEAAARVRGARQVQVLRSSLQLLNQLAGGAVSPYDSEVTRRCQSEESYLRELTLLDPSLTYLGEWLARALAIAHDRDVSLRIRFIASDAENAEVAAFIGKFLLDVTYASAANTAVTFSLYERGGKPIVSIVGGIGALRAVADSADQTTENWTVNYAELDDEALVDLSRA